MKRIFKYALKMGITELNMPLGSEVLTVQTQNNKPMLWALVDDDPMTRSCRARIGLFATGSALPVGIDGGDYIGTVQLDGGEFVLHAFHLFFGE